MTVVATEKKKNLVSFTIRQKTNKHMHAVNIVDFQTDCN